MNQQQGAMDVLMGMLLCIAILLAIWLVIYILFLLNLHRTLAAVDQRNREMSPGLVWLILVPILHIFWPIIVVMKIENSLRNEFRDRGLPTRDEGFARTVGMIWAWGGVVNLVLSVFQNIAQAGDMQPVAMGLSLLSCPIALGVFICWIIYWVQTYQYRKRLTEGPRGYREDSLEDDYDDYRRPGHREEYDDRPIRRDREPAEGRGGGDE